MHYYYDAHPTEEDLMGETAWHNSLIDYLKTVLRWLFREQACAIYSELNFYRTRNYREYPVVPDLAVIKGVAYRYTRNWVLLGGEPPPQVIFEILSEETWKKDVREKPSTYANMGVREYFHTVPYGCVEAREDKVVRLEEKPMRNWLVNEFAGDIHLIGRSGGEIEGLPIKTDLTQLPERIDVAGAGHRHPDRTGRPRRAGGSGEPAPRRALVGRADRILPAADRGAQRRASEP